MYQECIHALWDLRIKVHNRDITLDHFGYRTELEVVHILESIVLYPTSQSQRCWAKIAGDRPE